MRNIRVIRVLAMLALVAIASAACHSNPPARPMLRPQHLRQLHLYQVGQQAMLGGLRPGVQIDVTLTKIVTTSHAVTRLREPGQYWLALQFLIRNVGAMPYDGVVPDVRLAYNHGGSYIDVGSRVAVPGCRMFRVYPMYHTKLTIKPGTQARGCVVFTVPRGRRITSIMFAFDRGGHFSSPVYWRP